MSSVAEIPVGSAAQRLQIPPVRPKTAALAVGSDGRGGDQQASYVQAEGAARVGDSDVERVHSGHEPSGDDEGVLGVEVSAHCTGQREWAGPNGDLAIEGDLSLVVDPPCAVNLHRREVISGQAERLPEYVRRAHIARPGGVLSDPHRSCRWVTWP